MKYNVNIQVVANGYLVSYVEFVSQEMSPIDNNISKYTPLLSNMPASPQTMKIPMERNIIITDEKELVDLLARLRNKLASD